MAVKKFLDLSGVSTLLDQLKNIFVKTDDTTNTISSTDGSKIPTSQAVIDYVEENGGGGGGGGTSVAIAEDIPVTLLSTGWTGSSAPYSQTLTVLDVREGMTPLIFLQGQATDEQIYAYNLITDYQAGNGTITFYVAEVPEVDLPIVLKGVPAQEISYKDNTILVPVTASNFTLRSDQRYEQTLTVEGMTSGLGGTWDILRSGEVLSETESIIASNITDVIRQTNAVKIVCMEMPEQDYTIVLSGTLKDVAEGDIVLSGVGELVNRVDTLEDSVGTLEDSINTLEDNVELLTSNINNAVLLWTNQAPSASFDAQTISLSLNGYEGVEIEFAENGTIRCYAKAPLSYRGQVQYVSMIGTQVPYSVNLEVRTFAPTITGVQFFDGCISDNLSGSSSVITNNTKMIPIKIWGLKSISN